MIEQEQEQQVLEGAVTSVVYQNQENGYTVRRLDSAGETVTAVGCMPGVGVGEELAITGRWITHPTYGEQFKADWAERKMPRGRQAIYAYLASGAIKNIGPAKAKDIVDRFGDETLSVMENEPEKLASVRGISRKLAMQVGAWYRRQIGLRRLIEFLARYGIRPSVGVALYKCYGDEAIQAVRDDPYIIVGESFGAQFHEADAMALEMGFDADCTQRLEAALQFELHHNLNNGHTFLPRRKLLEATASLLDVGSDAVEEALVSLIDGGKIVTGAVAGQDACYLYSIYCDETAVAARLSEMAAFPASEDGGEPDVRRAEAALGVTYAPEQRQALAMAARGRIMVLTGGPGTGKTTCVRGILEIYDRLGLRTVLCAPTGRAAKRLSEVTGRAASTIHRLLGAAMTENDTVRFEHNETDPIECDAVIMDETSMVDIRLMHALLSALPLRCRLVLVGDADQLPSVGPGNVFADIIRSEAVPTVRLTEIFRQAKLSGIVRSAHKINAGELPDLRENKGDFFMLRRTSAQATAQTIVELCAKRLPQKMGITPDNIQVLSPTRRHETGTDNLNRLLQAAVNPPSPEKRETLVGETVLREGDRVMQTKNNYDLIWHKQGTLSLPWDEDGEESAVTLESGSGVFNGDIGTVTSIDAARQTVRVDFDDRYVEYPFDLLPELETAYAMTVHKSQGSEYKAVILAAFDGASRLMVRSVLYTAVTRARELLIIVGDENVVAAMTANDRKTRRYSGLRARLAGETQDAPEK